MRTIRVTGKGQLKVTPDVMRITISMTDRHTDYSEALRRSTEDTEKLKDLLMDHGFERTDLKTLNFSIDTEYERMYTSSALSATGTTIFSRSNSISTTTGWDRFCMPSRIVLPRRSFASVIR